MKESFKSVRIWFSLIGTFGVHSIINLITDFNSYTIFGTITTLISVIFALFYLYFGIKLKELLPSKKKFIQNIILAGGIYNIA